MRDYKRGAGANSLTLGSQSTLHNNNYRHITFRYDGTICLWITRGALWITYTHSCPHPVDKPVDNFQHKPESFLRIT